MTPDIQYGPAVASVYDDLVAPSVPPATAVERLRPHVTGKRVLEVGVGTGRVALPLADIAAEVVGMDNSPEMLQKLRAKGVPPNMTVVEGDFRGPFPVSGRFEAAYSLMGSLACVETEEELSQALSRVHDVLEPGATFSMEYYFVDSYRRAVEMHEMTLPQPDGSSITFTADIDDGNVLTWDTRLDQGDGKALEFSERVLMLEPDRIRTVLHDAGFRVEEVYPVREPEPYIWFLTRCVEREQNTGT
ncbi:MULTISPECIES: class I SAM-dependent methyltransferase [unclassified Streptomyces]|uniref:class I SAM-dependent methyltransferase n=1 Tax=unclassified Streptomyces TaxID=2593676 RepID=UPI001908CDA7|nr:class I SAM-dependent methyltransferase [Streptomyces sp. HSG2]